MREIHLLSIPLPVGLQHLKRMTPGTSIRVEEWPRNILDGRLWACPMEHKINQANPPVEWVTTLQLILVYH